MLDIEKVLSQADGSDKKMAQGTLSTLVNETLLDKVQKKIEILTTQYDQLKRSIDGIDKQREQLLNKRNELVLDLAKVEGGLKELMELRK